jgi:hypothetical protein
MPAKLTLYPVKRAPRFLVIRDNETLEIGRGPAFGLFVEDPRVSKRHARLAWTGTGWKLEDLGSKNGTTHNGHPATGAELGDGDWISFGGLMARFERLTAAEAANLSSQLSARLQTSADLKRRLTADLAPIDLLLRFLESATEVTRTERGFVVVVQPDGRLRVVVAAGFSPEAARGDRFSGSVGVVKEVLDTGGPVVVANVPGDPRLGTRPSVVALGIWSVVGVPLRHEGRVTGVIYMDSRTPGRFTSLDIGIVEALADHAATVLAESLADRNLGQAPHRPEDAVLSQMQQRLAELLPGLGG